MCGCAVSVAGSTGSAVNFTDYIEFQHSDDEAGDESEELLHTNGVSGSGHAAPLDDWTWGKLLKDIWTPGTDAESARVNHAFTPEGGSGAFKAGDSRAQHGCWQAACQGLSQHEPLLCSWCGRWVHVLPQAHCTDSKQPSPAAASNSLQQQLCQMLLAAKAAVLSTLHIAAV